MRAFSTREISELTGLSADRIRRWAREELIAPQKDDRGRWCYSFQDLAALRAAVQMERSGVSASRVARTLRQLRDQLPDGRPISAVRILVIGHRVVVKDRLAAWEPESRQGAFDFDNVQDISAKVAATPAPPPEPMRKSASADELYQTALDLELAGQGDEARETYLEVLERDPNLVAARVNLGRLLHTAGQLTEAEDLYRAALRQNGKNVVAAFNLGVVLEDQGKFGDAVEAYRDVLTIDDDYADAHYNLSRILEAQGDVRGALRHLSRFRRLIRST